MHEMSDQPAHFCPHGGVVLHEDASPATLAGRREGRGPSRLRAAATLSGSLWVLYVSHQALRGELDGAVMAVSVVVAGLAAGLVWLSYRAERESILAAAGSLYLLLTSLAIAAVEQHVGLAVGLGAGISWNALWVALFPLMVPCSPRHTLVKAVVAATITPATLALFVLAGARALPPIADVVALVTPVYVGAFIAWVGAGFIERLGSRITEMESVGRYTLVRRLGEGGMGDVWEAEHRQLARPVALKLIKHGKEDRTKLSRFEREARVTASLKSAHTVDLYDFGATRDGRLYYAMELLEGMDLERLVNEYGPMPKERVAHLLGQALDSLEEAHARGLVHRDIKPANLHLGRYGLSDDHLKVLDFGLVTSSDGGVDGVNLTADGRISGTPGYMSPEAVAGDREIDGRADIYALGCVAIFLLTGERVFPEAKHAIAAAVAHVTDTPASPSARGVSLPADFEAVLMATLEKDPIRRPDAASLREMLDSCALDEWTQSEARSWWAQNSPLPPLRTSEVTPDGPTHLALPAHVIAGHA